jgi:DNA-binding NarL/FixJ family response regulator/class 3 adenylate cyclase
MSGTTTIIFTDIEGSTGTVFDLGDRQATGAILDHLRILREQVHAHHGQVVKTLGDGLMAVFDSAYNGCLAAIGMQQAVELAGRVSGDIVGGLRVGVHVGEVVEDSDDDVYGAAVVVARRLCDAAAPGTILVSELVSLLVANRADTTFQAVDPAPLKGVPEPVTAALLDWAPLPEQPPVRVVVADDAALVRAGIVRLLADQGFEVVAEADDHDSLLAAVVRTRPDLVVTDIRMPPGQHDEGLRAAAHIRTSQPDTAVLVLSQYIEASAAASLLDGQPSGIGYLLKERVSDLDEFVDVARRIAQGESVIDPLVTQQLLGRARDRDSVAQLTDREREVLDLMAQGLSNHAIASSLFLSAKTVESHVRSIFGKLGLPDDAAGNRRVQAVVRWLDAAR